MGIQLEPSPETDPQGVRDQVARRIARELRSDPTGCRKAKVTSLLHAFRVPGSHTDIGHLTQVLWNQNISATSGRPDITRRDVLELALQRESDVQDEDQSSGQGVRVSVWRPGEPGRIEQPVTADMSLDPGPEGILWFDIEPPAPDLRPEKVQRRVAEVASLLQGWCPQVDDLMVRDLLTPDVQPKVETYGDERTGVRSVSVAAVIARESPDEDDDFDGVDEQLIFQMVEIIVGPGWLLTCWHPSREVSGGGEALVGPPLLREPFLSHVAHRWLHDDTGKDTHTAKGAGDLGIYLSRSLVATYGASLRMLQRWVSSWEVGFYKSLSHQDKPKRLKGAAAEISNFLAMVGEFQRGVTAFRLAGEEMPNKTWFADAPGRSDNRVKSDPDAGQAGALAASVKTAVEKLGQLSADIRADMDLLMIQSQATQQESAERLQAHLGKVTGLVLVPTFVAGLFGANTALPGGGSWAGFEIMVLLMVVSAAASYLVIRKLID